MEPKSLVLFCLGQSNSHGHGTQLPIYKTKRQFTKVFGLSREKNQSYNLHDIEWKSFQYAGMNLGESQDNTYCLAQSFADLWQDAADTGTILPDLYLVQISVGAQGIAETEKNGYNMWYPKRKPVLIPGDLHQVNISLTPLACQILSLTMTNLRRKGSVGILGLHWNQWETEVDTGGLSILNASENYTKLFSFFDQAIGQPYPLYLYKPLSAVYNNPVGVKVLTDVFETFCNQRFLTKMLDLSQAYFFDLSAENQGIFQSDLVHYHSLSHTWFALQQWNDYQKERQGQL